jgi:phosphonate transport system permease protein
MSFGLQLVVRPPQGRFGWTGVGVITLAVLGFLYWAALGAQINGTNLWNGFPFMWDFLVRMMPPNPGFLERLWKPALESLQVAVWGTLLGVVISVPIPSTGMSTTMALAKLALG